MSGSVFWIIVAGAVILAALAGPFFTLERLTFPERLVFWGVTVVLSSILMTFLSICAYRLTEARGGHWLMGAVLAGLAGTVPVVGTVYLAEGVATGFAPGWATNLMLAPLTLYTAPSVVAMTVIVNLIIEKQARAEPAVATPQLLRRQTSAFTVLQSKLPDHLGREIIAVRAQDHYVEVTTPKGSATILMRLSDAVRDLEPLGGLQVHRSWWVNLNHVAREERGPNGLELVLSSGLRAPVGRSFRADYREAAQAAAE